MASKPARRTTKPTGAKPIRSKPKNQLDRPRNLGNPRMGWGSDVVAEVTRQVGLKYIAFLPGASFRGFHDSLVNYLGNETPQMVLCLHEQHAVSIADGYGKVTGEPMAVALHANVGLMHAMLALFNAWGNRSPMVIFGANGPIDANKRRPWIDWVHTTKYNAAMIRQFIKWDDEPHSPQAAVESVLRANQIARTVPKGPVYICLDAGFQEARIPDSVVIPDVARFAPAAPPAAPDEAVRQTLQAVRAAKFPLILMGRGSRDKADWDRRVKLAEALGAVVCTTLRSSCSFPTEHPLHVAAPSFRTTDEIKALVRRADVILSFDWLDLSGFLRLCTGASQTQRPISAKVINCSLDSYLANGWNMDYEALPAADLPILANPDTFIAQLLKALGSRAKGRFILKPAIKRLGHWTRRKDARAKPRKGGPMTTADIGLCLSQVLRGRPASFARLQGGWPVNAARFSHPLDYLGNDGGGTMGSGVGYSVGAALALKGTGRIPITVLGDGTYIMGVTALWTAVRMDFPMLIIVDNNRAYHNDETHQHQVAKERGRPTENKSIGLRIDNPDVDLVGLARNQGFEAEGPIETTEELTEVLERAIDAVARGGRYLLDVRTGPGSDLFLREVDGGRK